MLIASFMDRSAARLAAACSFLILLAFSAGAQNLPFDILDASLDAARRPSIQVAASPGSYYVLLRGPSVAEIRIPVAAAFGAGQAGADVTLSDPLAIPGAGERFYRVQRRSVTTPTDLDGDSIDDVYELGLSPHFDPLNPDDADLDPDGDGLSNRDEYLQGTDPLTPNSGGVTTFESSPDQLETGVSVQRETIFRFSRPLAPGTTVPQNALYAVASGRRILSRAEVSGDLRKITLFYLEPLPGASRVRVHLDGTAFRDAQGQTIDADRDGRPGGIGTLEFDTFGNRPLDSTGVIGQVFASELVPGPNGNSVNRPLEGVIITVDGAEETLRAVTDAQGRFVLQPAPAGRFFVHIDGRTAVGSTYPQGDYYPVVGKPWETIPGKADNLAGETGIVYLPLIRSGSLQPVSSTLPTTITFAPEVVTENPDLAGVEIRVPANALLADDGTRGGRVGIAPVAPDRIPSPLPNGLVLPLVITIQTDGPQNFDQPIPVRFPNLPDPVSGRRLGPGEKSALWSFNHDTGRWELVGPMTVTADGNFVESDPGVGVLQPGWHGTQPGVGAGGGPLGGPDPCGGGGGPGAGARDCRQNPDFNPSDPANYNGCGPDGWDYLVPDNPNGLLFPCATFAGACTGHDIGYNTCGKPRQETDDQFLQGMLAACDCLSGLKQSECRTLAVLYHRAVTGGGEGAYNDAQDKACLCEDPPPPPPGCGDAGGSSPSLANGPGARDVARRLALHAPRLAAQVGPGTRIVPQLGAHRFAVIDVASGQVVQRGRAGSAGIAFAELILAPRTTYDIGILQESTLREGVIRITTGESGSRFNLPPILIKPPTSWDFDLDGLHDAGELILGTDPQQPDSDGDGIHDGAEARQGSNPLDGSPIATGVIGSATTPGQAVDIAAFGELLATANADDGITLFHLADPFAPTRIASIDTPGRATAVAVNNAWIAVADGTAGVALIDSLNPATARITRQLQLGSAAKAIALAGDIAYAGLDDGSVHLLDLQAGATLERVPLGTGPIQDLFLDRDSLLALTPGRLHILPLDGGELRPGSSIASPGSLGAGGRRLRVFAAGGLAYATHTSGFNVFDISNPSAPTLVRANATQQQGWKQILPTGNGLAVAAVSPNSTDDGPHDVSLYQLGPDGAGNQFLATFPTPGLASALTLHHGLAYVADGRSGLQVLHYLAFDRAGQPPTLSLEASFPLDPPQSEEGKLVRISAVARDDVQVRNVEFYVDGRLAASDGSFGYDARFITPLRTPDRQSFLLRARAIDTGGNATWTDDLEVRLVSDASPPRVIRRFPAPGAIEGDLQSIHATFDEPVRPESLNPLTVRLRGAGPDGGFGTADDPVLPAATVLWRGERNTVVLEFAENLPGGLFEARVTPPISDLAGNALARDVVWTFWVVGEGDADGDGVPDALEAALGTDPNNPDSDGDGTPDGAEDPDRDGLRTGWELVNGLDPRVADSDGNGIRDGDEDPDNDGVRNGIEHDNGLNARSADSDGDGWDDGGELASGSDPASAGSQPLRLVVSASASFLNAVPDNVPAGTPLVTTSSPVSYLNALPESVPAGTPVTATAQPVSYLNALPDNAPSGTRISTFSPVVTFLNALPESVGPVSAVSPVVSYSNR